MRKNFEITHVRHVYLHRPLQILLSQSRYEMLFLIRVYILTYITFVYHIFSKNLHYKR